MHRSCLGKACSKHDPQRGERVCLASKADITLKWVDARGEARAAVYWFATQEPAFAVLYGVVAELQHFSSHSLGAEASVITTIGRYNPLKHLEEAALLLR